MNKADITADVANEVAPTFFNVGTDGENAGITLADLKVGGYEEHVLENAFTILEINGNGVLLQREIPDGGGAKMGCQYTWQDYPEAGIPAGWYDEGSNLMADKPTCEEWGLDQSVWGEAKNVKFAFGYGFRATPTSGYGNLALVFSGEVRQGLTEYTQMTPDVQNNSGNCTPVSINLGQITVGGYEEAILENALVLTEINANGVLLQREIPGGGGAKMGCQYTWQDYPEAGIPAGWYDEGSNLMADKPTCEEWGLDQSAWGEAKNITFTAGQGFQVLPNSAFPGLTIKLPSPMGK